VVIELVEMWRLDRRIRQAHRPRATWKMTGSLSRTSLRKPSLSHR